MKSLLLDQTVWDLVLDANGNIACGTAPYATAQDVATAARTFATEAYYDTTLGIPYFADTLGKYPPTALVFAHLENAALTVPEVVAAQCIITSTSAGTFSLQFTDINGVTSNVSL